MSDLCDCGKPAVSLCGTGGDYPTVVQCMKPVCKPGGHWCEVHRHAPGSMTFGLVNAEMRAEFQGFASDGTFWDWCVTLVWNLMPLKWKLKKILGAHARAHAPPAPLPKMVLFIKGRRFEQVNGVLEEKHE